MRGRFSIRRPSPALVISIIALVAASAGTSIAAIGLGALSPKAKDKTVGVGKLTYVSTTARIPAANSPRGADVSALCPSGLEAIGGGIKVGDDRDDFVNDSHLIAGGWAGTVFNSNASADHTATVTVACAKSRRVFGSPPAS